MSVPACCRYLVRIQHPCGHREESPAFVGLDAASGYARTARESLPGVRGMRMAIVIRHVDESVDLLAHWSGSARGWVKRVSL